MSKGERHGLVVRGSKPSHNQEILRKQERKLSKHMRTSVCVSWHTHATFFSSKVCLIIHLLTNDYLTSDVEYCVQY